MGEEENKNFISPLIQASEMVDIPIGDSPFKLPQIEGNLFQGIDINVDKLKTALPADLQSVKSFKSMKSEAGKILSKRAKLKLRRETLMQKLSVLTPRGAKNRNKKKKKKQEEKESAMADLSGLNDALLSLLQPKIDVAHNAERQNVQKKKKGVENASKQKKKRLQGIQLFQNVYKNKQFKSDPRSVIAKHIKAVIAENK